MEPESKDPSEEPSTPESPDGSDQEPADVAEPPEPAAPSPSATPDASGSSSQPKPVKRLKKKRKVQTPPPAEPEPSKPAAGAAGSRRWLVIGIAAVLVAAVGGTALVLARRHAGPSRWKVGQEVPVEITIVAGDRTNLACAATDEVTGKHCAFEASAKAWSKGPSTDDKAVLKPYTTTDRHNFVAAGLWSDPALTAPLPAGRFSVKCTFVVEGTLKTVSVRWAPAGPWSEPLTDWYAGSIKGCTLVRPAPASAPAKS